jgi:hypothetical protein
VITETGDETGRGVRRPSTITADVQTSSSNPESARPSHKLRLPTCEWHGSIPDSPADISRYSGCQAVFTLGRFFGVVYLKWLDPAFSLFLNGIGLCIFSILTSTIKGHGGIACLFLIFWFERWVRSRFSLEF